MVLDHIVPRARGGTNVLKNLQLLCHHCNSVKGVRSWESFLKSQQRSIADTDEACLPTDPAENKGSQG